MNAMREWKYLVAAMIALAFLTAAHAQLQLLGVGPSGGFGGGGGDVCTGAADFSDGCAIAIFGH